MIQIKDLHKSYHMGSNSLHVLKGIDFSVKEGEMVSIMGSSGSGKSTLLNILGMLDEADLGSSCWSQGSQGIWSRRRSRFLRRVPEWSNCCLQGDGALRGSRPVLRRSA